MLGSHVFKWYGCKPREAKMRLLKFLLSGFIGAAIIAPLGSVSYAEEDSLYVPLYTYRTGPFAANGVKVANG